MTGPSSKKYLHILMLGLASAVLFPVAASARNATDEICPRPPRGSTVSEPEDLRSKDGVLQVDFTYRSDVDASGRVRYCYLYKDGTQAPNLRLHPGDWLILTLRNGLNVHDVSQPQAHDKAMQMPDSCGDGTMDAWSTNLHFHGLSVPPVCHQDDVLKTSIAPTGKPFEYRFQIPMNEPPGLYWYHPHIHGFSNAQVLGGASGALIVEGIERANKLVAGLEERVLIVRDQDLLNPEASPVKSTVNAPVLRDAEGDILNTGNGLGKPAKDLSINFVPVPYPDYPPAVIPIRPGERQLWRVLNASAITYLDLQILLDGIPQSMGVVSFDGVPINENAKFENRIIWESHVLLPPAGRIEFIFKGPADGKLASLVTRAVDTGPAGENDPVRPLADIISKADAPEPRSALPASPEPAIAPTSEGLGNVKAVRERKLYFSEQPSDPNNPASPTVFMITVDGEKPVPYDPHSTAPNITVQQGDVEDWIIENRSRELHAFHIHQIHCMLVNWNGVPIDEPFLRGPHRVPSVRALVLSRKQREARTNSK